MAIEFPLSSSSPWTDQHGQVWVWNDKNWVRQAADPGIEEAPDDGQQYVRRSLEWAINSAGSWYLGPKDTPPSNDNNGNPLQEGYIYYNNIDNEVYYWDGTAWGTFGAKYIINTIGEYSWDSLPIIAVEGSLTWPDEYGNTPGNWINGGTFVTLYVDGVRQVQELNGSLITGDYIVDYANNNIIVKNNSIPANASIAIQVGKISADDHISYDDNNASG